MQLQERRPRLRPRERPPRRPRATTTLRTRAPDSPSIDRYEEAARLITGRKRAKAEDLIEWLKTLSQTIGIPGLGTYGITRDHFDELIAQASQASSMKGNPISLKGTELSTLLGRSL